MTSRWCYGIKLARFLRFSSDRDDARRFLRDVHGPHAAALPGVCGYVQNHVSSGGADLGADRGRSPVDAYECWWWPDRAAVEFALRSSEFRRLDDAGVDHFDASNTSTVLLDERVIKDGERGPFKLASFTPFRRDLPAATVRDRWIRQHGPLTLRAGGFTRYVQNHVLAPHGDDDWARRPTFDGVAEHWFRSADDFSRVRATTEWHALFEDGHHLFDMATVTFAVVGEVVFAS